MIAAPSESTASRGVTESLRRADDDTGGRSYGLVELWRLLIRHRRATAAFPLIVAVFAAIVSLIIPAAYTATTTFVPEPSTQARVPSGLAGLAGLATQFGIGLGIEA